MWTSYIHVTTRCRGTVDRVCPHRKHMTRVRRGAPLTCANAVSAGRPTVVPRGHALAQGPTDLSAHPSSDCYRGGEGGRTARPGGGGAPPLAFFSTPGKPKQPPPTELGSTGRETDMIANRRKAIVPLA